MRVTLTRTKYSATATTGELNVPGIEKTLYTLEPPWRDNRGDESCIPLGDYLCVPHGWERHTPFKKKKVWEITNVGNNRTAVLFHVGNYPKDSLGCVLVGTTSTGENVWHSGDAIEAMRTAIGINRFDLHVEDAPTS